MSSVSSGVKKVISILQIETTLVKISPNFAIGKSLNSIRRYYEIFLICSEIHNIKSYLLLAIGRCKLLNAEFRKILIQIIYILLK